MSALQGCSDMNGLSWINDRWGPSPVLVAAASTDAASRQVAVVNAMIASSGLVRVTTDPVTQQLLVPQPVNRSGWYTAITSGFNVIDDACQTYLDDLWKLDRQRTAATGIITATGAAVSAIVNSGGNARTSTLAILTQAFGLAGTLTTDISNTYLYAKDPATVKGLVDKMMDAYRQDFNDKVNGNSATKITALDESQYPIQTYPAAYYRMREYLSLCLPPTIDAQVMTLLSNSNAVSKAPAGTQPATSGTPGQAGGPAPAGSLSTVGGTAIPGTAPAQISLTKIQLR
jgi:hypothetical protein